MARRRLAKKDIRALNATLEQFGVEFSKKDAVELVTMEAGTFTVVNGEPAFVSYDGLFFPHLKFLQTHTTNLPRLTVDMGAVPYVCDGADIMRPGVVAVDEGVVAGALVIVVDEQHGKPLAVCKALLDAAPLKEAVKGKVAENIHYVGDVFWKLTG
ncbi:DUF1947 domain-containing protein [Candidatus Woesearchaeota archaeon]|nr:MAG: DUF1947 domain-containing protein [Candidatus Woesearchaeota archaeon]